MQIASRQPRIQSWNDLFSANIDTIFHVIKINRNKEKWEQGRQIWYVMQNKRNNVNLLSNLAVSNFLWIAAFVYVLNEFDIVDVIIYDPRVKRSSNALIVCSLFFLNAERL